MATPSAERYPVPDLHELDDEPVLPHLGLRFLHEDWLVTLAPFKDPSSIWETAYRSPEGGPVVLCDGECLIRLCVLAHEVGVVFGVDP